MEGRGYDRFRQIAKKILYRLRKQLKTAGGLAGKTADRQVMKDYYKTLGLKANASDGEIRARWIKLMRRLHPDVKGRTESQEGRAKEINEAYQVLKDALARMEYDLQRNYYREKHRLQHGRKGLLLGLGGVLFVVAVVLVLNFSPRKNPSLTPIAEDTGTQKTREVSVPKREEPGRAGEASPAALGRGAESPGRKPAATTGQTAPAVPGRGPAEAEKPKATRPPQEEGIKVLPREGAKTMEQEDVRTVRSLDTKTPRQTDARTLMFEEAETRDLNVPGIQGGVGTAAQRPMGTVPPKGEEPRIPESGDRAPPRQADAPPRMGRIANEEEIRDFLAGYIARYARRDIQGFLSCFSLQAVQNRKEGFQEIKKIYAGFFDQSRELRYELQDLIANFYENNVVVNGRYRLDQVSKKGQRRTWKGDIRWTLIKEGEALKILLLDYQQQRELTP